jgi:K+-transporting ATPase KdpF subunit
VQQAVRRENVIYAIAGILSLLLLAYLTISLLKPEWF